VSPTRSDDIPALDVEKTCQGIVSQSSNSTMERHEKVSFENCMKSEQDDRALVAKEWPSFSSADKVHCLAVVRSGGEASYTDFITCLEMARDVRKLDSAPARSNSIMR
jgi:hypothetical protein